MHLNTGDCTAGSFYCCTTEAVLPHSMPRPLQQNWCLAMGRDLVNTSATMASVLLQELHFLAEHTLTRKVMLGLQAHTPEWSRRTHAVVDLRVSL